LFVGIPIAPAIRQLLSSLGGTVPGARAVPEDQIHLTLRFIGEVEPSTMTDIKESLEGIESSPLSLSIKGAGHFPPRGQPRVIWAGIDPAGDVIILRNRVNNRLSLCGIKPEQRKFHPHVTLARLKNTSPKRVASFLAVNALLESPPFDVNQVRLYSSTLHPGGAIHRVEAVYPLAGT
ncbi:MAG: RNA 2',3'-cyclic phosphodiesterase, partial [Desulfofustis sp.]|nr:RNA 2',3'-cyclic phosphodiesterase [Desulfofustis sp.]